LKEINILYEDNINIYDAMKVKNICTVYYGFKNDNKIIQAYEFKLGKLLKEVKIKNVLRLDEWEKSFNEEVRKTTLTLNDIKKNIISWVSKYKNKNILEYNQFIETLKVYRKYTDQIIILYQEFNKEIFKIMPIVRLNDNVEVKELYLFARQKSMELWNREFTCLIVMVKTFWKNQLGTYSPNKLTIHFSEYLNSAYSKEKILDTLLHEMVHWHLHTSGQKYDDEDFEFIAECIRIGCGLSLSSKAQKAFINYKEHQKII
jgi:hypothetical protein